MLMDSATEVSNDRDLGPAFNKRIIDAMRKAGDVKIISSVNTPPDIVTARHLDHMMVNFGVNISEDRLKKIHDAGAKLWYQNVGETRYTEGLFMLRTGAIGRRQWVGAWYSGDPYSDWDGGDATAHVLPSPEGSLPHLHFAWMSEGVDDMRYFLALRRLIAHARKSGSAEAGALADKAQADHDEMMATCPIALPDGARIGKDGLAVIEGFKDKDTFDRYRLRAATHLKKLWKALRSPAAAKGQ